MRVRVPESKIKRRIKLMFGLEYIPAFIKIAFNIAFSIVSAIPSYFAWNCIAPIYLAPYIPNQFLNLPYWHIVSIFLVCTFLGEQIQKLTPTIISIHQSNN
jgi:hypothetical protein